MSDDEICEVRISGALKLVVTGLASFVLILGISYFQSTGGTLLGEVQRFGYYAVAAMIVAGTALTLIRLAWRVRVSPSQLSLRKVWGWEHYRFRELEHEEAWRDIANHPSLRSAWMLDDSPFKLTFIGGRTLEINPAMYAEKRELKGALLRAFAIQTLGSDADVVQFLSTWTEPQRRTRPATQRLIDALPALAGFSQSVLGFGIFAGLRMIGNDIAAVVPFVIFQILAVVSGRWTGTIIANGGVRLKYFGYYLKGVAGLCIVAGMAAAAVLSSDSANFNSDGRITLAVLSALYWALGVAIYFGADQLIRPTRQAD